MLSLPGLLRQTYLVSVRKRTRVSAEFGQQPWYRLNIKIQQEFACFQESLHRVLPARSRRAAKVPSGSGSPALLPHRAGPSPARASLRRPKAPLINQLLRGHALQPDGKPGGKSVGKIRQELVEVWELSALSWSRSRAASTARPPAAGPRTPDLCYFQSCEEKEIGSRAAATRVGVLPGPGALHWAAVCLGRASCLRLCLNVVISSWSSSELSPALLWALPGWLSQGHIPVAAALSKGSAAMLFSTGRGERSQQVHLAGGKALGWQGQL